MAQTTSLLAIAEADELGDRKAARNRRRAIADGRPQGHRLAHHHRGGRRA